MSTSPRYGTLKQWRKAVTDGTLAPTELCWLTDAKRVVRGGEISAPAYLGPVPNQGAMLALYLTHKRGCFMGDLCFRSDLGSYWLCISGTGSSAASWIEVGVNADSVRSMASQLSSMGASLDSLATSLDLGLTTLGGRADAIEARLLALETGGHSHANIDLLNALSYDETSHTLYVGGVAIGGSSGGSGGGSDTLFSNVKLLLNGSSLTDTSSLAQELIATGITLDTDIKKNGVSSYYSDATGQIVVPFSSWNNFDATDFTIECWFRTSTTSVYATLISKYPGSWGPGVWSLMLNHAGQGSIGFYCYAGNGGDVFLGAGSGVWTSEVWTHVALSRSGDDWFLHVGGSLVASKTQAVAMVTTTAPVWVAGDQHNGRRFAGWLDDLRITSGVSRYTAASFTPPA